MILIDVHHHTTTLENRSGTVLNLSNRFNELPESGNCSVGLHPWYLQEATMKQEFESLKQASLKPQVLAIGECGLDKVCETDWTLQERIFQLQVAWAEQIQKPLIIHCVRAYPEVIRTLKIMNKPVTVIFHGFNKSQALADELLDNGYYLSFGKHIFNENAAKVLATIPFDRLFLETDSAPIPIEEIYAEAGRIRNMTVETLQKQISANALRVFGKSLNRDE